MFYKLHKALCDDFPGLTPFIIRETDCEEVFKLLKRRKAFYKEENKNTPQQKQERRRVDPRNATWLS